jgi:hypothetical protein
MRHALLAPCAVFLSVCASAQPVETKATTGNSNASPVPVTGSQIGSPAANLGGASLTPSLGLTPTMGGAALTPTPTPNGAAPIDAAASPVPTAEPLTVSPLAKPGAKTPAAKTPAAKAAPLSVVPAVTISNSIAPEGGKSAPGASSSLDSAARGIAKGREAEATGAGDGLSVRRALDRAYDSSVRNGDVSSSASSVAGKFSGAREKIANFVGVANNSTPADAPDLYRTAIKTAEDSLPKSVAAAVSKAVLSFAARKADLSLSELVQAAYSAATAGQAAETKRLVKSVDKWEELLGAPGRPLIANGDRLKAGIEGALANSKTISGAKGSAPRVWLVKRDGRFVAALPGTSVEKLPSLGASFKLKLESLAASPVADAYRAFVARPGARSAISARVAMGESVPAATIGVGWLWLKYLVMRAWNGLLAMLPGRGLPTVADAASLPRLRAAASSWRDAVTLGERAARAAGSPRPTVSRARGAFLLALKSAAAHEALTRESGAVSRIERLSAEFEAGVKRAGLSPADALTPALTESVAGDGGLRHWAARYAADARERGGTAFAKVRGASSVVPLGEGPASLAAPRLLAASKSDLRVVAFEDSLWASGSGAYGAVKLSADLRSTESGGSVALETERGDERLARELDGLGFAVTRAGSGLRAKLDAETASVDAREMSSLAADGAALITGSPAASSPAPEGLTRLLADVRRSPGEAEKKAAGLDGSSVLARAKTVAWVGDLEAVSAELPSRGERVIALRDPATGLPKYARVEALRVK